MPRQIVLRPSLPGHCVTAENWLPGRPESTTVAVQRLGPVHSSLVAVVLLNPLPQPSFIA